VADLNGGAFQTAAVIRSGMETNILLPFQVYQGQYTEVRIYYNGKPSASELFPTSGFFEGGGSNPFSASPPYNSYTWWPCKQVLTDKADSSWFFITTDTPNIAISNGLLTGDTQINAKQKCWEWKSHHTIDFYLIAFAVGSFTETTQYFHPEGRSDSMIVEYYNYTPNGTEVLDILQLYSKLFGLYPFYDEKFGITRINLSGGMENQTMVMMGASGIEAHETAHMWFGDNVTCGSWNDIMLNEGFAHWCESVYPEFANANHDSARISHCNGYETQILNTSYQPSDNVSSGYGPADTTSVLGVFGPEWIYYDKNAMMLNTLRFEINNDSLFFLALQNYQSRYATGTAFATDLRDIITSTTGIDQTEFFNEFYYGFGYPAFNIVYNEEQGNVNLSISETTSDPAATPFFKTYLEVKIQGTQNDTVVRLYIDQDTSTFTIPFNDIVTGFVVDPNQWLANAPGTVQNAFTLNTSPVSGSPFDISDSAHVQVSVNFTSTATFYSDNIFTAQVSDSLGNFANAVTIGTLSGADIGTINALIPNNSPAGSVYRIRVTSTDPPITGSDNGTNLQIIPFAVSVAPQDTLTTVSNKPAASIKASSNQTVAAYNWQWSLFADSGYTNFNPAQNADTLAAVFADTGVYYVNCTITNNQNASLTTPSVVVIVTAVSTIHPLDNAFIKAYWDNGSFVVDLRNAKLIAPVLELMNINGQVVAGSELYNGGLNRLETNLAAGTYIFRITDGSRIYSGKTVLPGR
jgi:hypothetical protein